MDELSRCYQIDVPASTGRRRVLWAALAAIVLLSLSAALVVHWTNSHGGGKQALNSAAASADQKIVVYAPPPTNAGGQPSAGEPETWTRGKKTLLFIRIDFRDLPGEPVAEQEMTKILEQVDAYYQRVSYGKLSIKSTVTPTLRMPRTAGWYEQTADHEQIIRDARSGAKAVGLDTAGFDLDIVAFKTKGGGDSGVGAVGGKGLRLLNNFRFGINVHELGHNFGLPHTDVWKTWDGSIIGPGRHIDMGDPYDPMGGGGDNPLNDFSIRSKSLLGWLGREGICTVTASGTYRIYAHDMPGAQDHVRGLLIKRDAQNFYWVEFRQRQSDNPFMMNGARILRSFSYNNELDLLDMTPDSPLGAKDAALLLGRTFSDAEAGLYITPMSKGNTTPESLEIAVKFGQFPSHRQPSLRLTSSARTAKAGETIEFQAQADDPDNDSLQYSWDFGDGTFDWGKSTAWHRWSETDREYVVRCAVTDMKGGTAEKLLLATIGHPTTQRLAGRVVSNGRPLENARVGIDPTNSMVTDSDGIFAFVGLKAGAYRITAQKNGYWVKSVPVNCPAAGAIALNAVPLGRDRITSAGGIVLEGNDRLMTPGSFRPPVEIIIVAKTDATNLRLGYAAEQVIFNWEGDPSQLRMDGGPANEKHKPGAGAIPRGRFVTIRWVVTPKRQTIYVDNQFRYEHRGDYSNIDRPVSVFTFESKVTVKSLYVKPLPPDFQ